ncbi:MAG: hypothetical protein IRZ33_08190 [Alicyclobacillaceae bacterium]|nr:hypothetical protein [Alicyclobacillaceae bacterium]
MKRWKAMQISAVTCAALIVLAGCGVRHNTQHSGSMQTAKSTGTGLYAAMLPRAQTVQTAYPRSPLPGNLMIADRGNDRVIIVTPQKKIIWQVSFAYLGGSHDVNALGPDDAFFTPDHKHIIVNEEDDHAIAIIDIATKKTIWSYGHTGVPGSAPGYLNTPDDAYMLPNGIITTADIHNQRILFINPKTNRVIKQYGITGLRYHNPPKSFAAPNGDTPLPGGGMVVTEIGGSYADVLDKQGHLLYTVHFPDVAYPSDTQMLPNGDLLTVDYSTPGRVEIVNRQGKVVWEYYHTSGDAELSNPSLAIRLPNGNIAVNDDFNDRVVVINPKRGKIVWQYGHKGVPGNAPGYLNIPDGMDLMPADVKLPAVQK